MQKEMMHAPKKLGGGVSAKKFCIKLLLTLAVLVPVSSPAVTNAPPPTLLIAKQGTNIVLTIHGAGLAPFIVEVNDSLGSNTNWTKIHTNTTDNLGNTTFTNFGVVKSVPRRFYRLEKL